MKPLITALFLVLSITLAHAQAPVSVSIRDASATFPETKRRCGTTALHQFHELTDPGYTQRRAHLNAQTQQWISDYGQRKTANVVTIPVVVHVVYNGNVQNVSDAQIQSQMDALNRDFRRQNADTTNTPSDFASIVADTRIEFCLASVDPNGAPTNGITRTSTTTSEIGDAGVHYTAQGGKDGWNPNAYMNIWVCEIASGGDILGYATPPGMASPAEDGVVIDYRYFGTIGTAQAPFNMGRTGTHEVGHYLNLEHIWGLNGGCGDDDLVADTPMQEYDYSGCPSHPSASCNSNDMFMNYMDYVDDNCMNSFSQGQANRMTAALNGPRASLLTSAGCGGGVVSAEAGILREGSVRIGPNPARGMTMVKIDLPAARDIDLSVYNLLGQRMSKHSYGNVQKREIPLNLGNMANGLYLVEVRAGNKKMVKRLVVQ